MWVGVTRGFAGMKFSGSDSIVGVNRLIMVSVRMARVKPIISFVENKGWKGVFDVFDGVPRGLFDPVW